MNKLLLYTVSVLLVPFSSYAKIPEGLPVVSTHHYQPIDEGKDKSLQKRLNEKLASNPTWKKLADEKKMSVALVDITDPTAPIYSAINGENTMYAASMPKIAILLAVFQHIHDGKLEDTPAIRKDLNAMIRVSSNAAATRMIEAVGGLNEVNAVLTDPRYSLYDETHGGGLWVGKRYAKTGPRIGDPLNGISHAASSMQVARFYYLLATGRLVSLEASRDMLEIMSEPGINHKFVASLNGQVDGSDIFRKSGSWRSYHADSALVWGDDWRRYIIVCIVESSQGDAMLTDLITVAESILRKDIENDD